MKYQNKIINHYNDLIKINGFTKSGIGWKSNKLFERYNIFRRYINFDRKSILDYGAGLAHFYEYLKKNKIKYKKFYYYDLNKNLLNFVKIKYKSNIDYLKKISKQKYDIIIINGVYNYNFKKNNIVIRQDIKKLFNLTNHSLGISILNNDVDYKERHLFYHNEDNFLKFTKKICKKIIIDKTFSKYETFIILKK